MTTKNYVLVAHDEVLVVKVRIENYGRLSAYMCLNNSKKWLIYALLHVQNFETNAKKGLFLSMCVSGGMSESNQLTQEQETGVNFERLVNMEKNWKCFKSKYPMGAESTFSHNHNLAFLSATVQFF